MIALFIKRLGCSSEACYHLSNTHLIGNLIRNGNSDDVLKNEVCVNIVLTQTDDKQD